MAKDIMGLIRKFPNCCFECRYYRIHDCSSDCLLLGRTLSLGDGGFLRQADEGRTCDYWKKRPKTWEWYCKENPFWKDKYISREKQEKIRKRLLGV